MVDRGLVPPMLTGHLHFLTWPRTQTNDTLDHHPTSCHVGLCLSSVAERKQAYASVYNFQIMLRLLRIVTQYLPSGRLYFLVSWRRRLFTPVP